MLMNPYFPFFYPSNSIPQWPLYHPFSSLPNPTPGQFQKSQHQLQPQVPTQIPLITSQVKEEVEQSQQVFIVKQQNLGSGENESLFSLNKNESPRKRNKAHSKQLGAAQSREGRNSNSNILRGFFRRLKFKTKGQSIFIQNIIQKYDMRIVVSDFRLWLKTHKIDPCNYIKLSEARKLFRLDDEENKQYSKVLRILFKHFLSEEAIICTLTSWRSNRQKVKYSLQSIHNILAQVLELQ